MPCTGIAAAPDSHELHVHPHAVPGSVALKELELPGRRFRTGFTFGSPSSRTTRWIVVCDSELEHDQAFLDPQPILLRHPGLPHRLHPLPSASQPLPAVALSDASQGVPSQAVTSSDLPP